MAADEHLLGRITLGDVQQVKVYLDQRREEWEKTPFHAASWQDLEAAHENRLLKERELGKLKKSLIVFSVLVCYGWMCRLVRNFESWLDAGIIITILVLATVCLAISVVPLILILARFSSFALVGGFLFLFSALVAGIMLKVPKSEVIIEWSNYRSKIWHQIPVAKEEFDKTRDRYKVLFKAMEAKERFQKAQAEYDRVNAIWADGRNRLLQTPWRSYRGTQFEDFLSEVFSIHGYVVSLTKASGDQGVDLILQKGRRKIAIQAKGYTESVGNKAIQEVFAGMKFYDCDSCAAVTNSHFTSGAKELAVSVNCRLIDEDRVVDLILGKILL